MRSPKIGVSLESSLKAQGGVTLVLWPETPVGYTMSRCLNRQEQTNFVPLAESSGAAQAEAALPGLRILPDVRFWER